MALPQVYAPLYEFSSNSRQNRLLNIVPFRFQAKQKITQQNYCS